MIRSDLDTIHQTTDYRMKETNINTLQDRNFLAYIEIVVEIE